MSSTTSDDIASAAQLACLLEASAPKPGNVSPGRHFHDTRYEDFLASAAAIGGAFARAGERPLGATILDAVAATSRWTRSNTNLGIVLLLAPLAHAAHEACRENQDRRVRLEGEGEGGLEERQELADDGGRGGRGVERGQEAQGKERNPEQRGARGTALREGLAHVLRSTTVRDAADVYEAIRIARPAGLGQVADEDVSSAPSVTLREAMALAAERDGIAREYATAFGTTFEVGAPALARARRDRLSWDDAVVETYLTLLAATPDTHIARKLGEAAAVDVCGRARATLESGGVRTAAGRESVALLDGQLRDERNSRNPGTTADLTAAAIYVVLLEAVLQPSPDGNH